MSKVIKRLALPGAVFDADIGLKNIPALIFGGIIMISASLWSVESSAVPIITLVENCGSCLGGVYTFTQKDVVVGVVAGTERLRVKVEADTFGFINGSDRWVNAIGIKYYAATPLSASLFEEPSEGPWTLGLGKIGGAQGACDADATGAVSACTTSQGNTVGSVYTWIFDIVVPTGTPIIDDPNFQLRYFRPDSNNPLGKANGLVSEPTGSTCCDDPEIPSPEPASVGLFGLGLIGLAVIRRRRRRA